jgi:hypothetical protein
MSDATTLPPEDDDESAGNLAAPPVAAVPAPKPKALKPKAAKVVEEPVIEVIPAAARVKIILEENDNIPPTGLFIGSNGRSFLLRPGEEVEVPVEVIEVLNDAVEDVPRTDGNNNVVDYRKKMRFPYRLIGK